MKFSNLELQEIQKSGAAYIPVSLTYVDSNKNVKDSLLCVHDDKGVLDNGKNVVHEGTEKEYALQLLTAHKNMVERTKSILKTLKEKVINAANDTNTDADRATIQKELDQSVDQLEENANMTYNGQQLVDGSQNSLVLDPGTYTTFANTSLAIGTDSGVTPLTDMKERDGNSLGIQIGDTVSVYYVKNGETSGRSITVDEDSTLSDLFSSWSMNDVLGVPYDEDNPSLIGKDQYGQEVHTADGKDAVVYQAQEPGLKGQIAGLTFQVTRSDGTVNKTASGKLDEFKEVIRAQDPSPDNSISFQVGTRSNQTVRIGLTDMRPTALGLRAKDESTIFNKPFAFVFNPKKLLDEAKTIKFFSCSSYYDTKAENGNGREISLSSRTAPLVFEDGTEISSEMTIFDVAQKYGTSIFDKKVKDVASVVSIDRDKRILYEDVTRALLYAEKSMPGDNYRDNIKNLIGNLFDNAIEKCDMAIESNKAKRKEIYRIAVGIAE